MLKPVQAKADLDGASRKPLHEETSMTHEQPMSAPMQPMPGQMRQGGHLYTQTNEIRNCIIHYLRGPAGTPTALAAGSISRSAARKARRTLSRGRTASS